MGAKRDAKANAKGVQRKYAKASDWEQRQMQRQMLRECKGMQREMLRRDAKEVCIGK